MMTIMEYDEKHSTNPMMIIQDFAAIHREHSIVLKQLLILVPDDARTDDNVGCERAVDMVVSQANIENVRISFASIVAGELIKFMMGLINAATGQTREYSVPTPLPAGDTVYDQQHQDRCQADPHAQGMESAAFVAVALICHQEVEAAPEACHQGQQ